MAVSLCWAALPSSLVAFGSSLCPGKVRDLPWPGGTEDMDTSGTQTPLTHRHRGLGTPFLPQLVSDGKRQIGVLNMGDGVCAPG